MARPLVRQNDAETDAAVANAAMNNESLASTSGRIAPGWMPSHSETVISPIALDRNIVPPTPPFDAIDFARKSARPQHIAAPMPNSTDIKIPQ
jgi:hypothetical protein